MQLNFFENAPTSDTGAGDARRTPEPSRSARGHRQFISTENDNDARPIRDVRGLHGDGPYGDPVRVYGVDGRSCGNRGTTQVNRLTIRQRRALQRLAERQEWYDRTRSQTALQRLKDAVTDALRLGV